MNIFETLLEDELTAADIIDRGDYAEIEIWTRRQMAAAARWMREVERQINGRGVV